MDNFELNSKIKKAFINITPDIFNSILTDCDEKKGSAITMTTNKRSNFKKFTAIAAAFILVLAGIGAFGIYRNNTAVSSVVSLDVNPSIDIKLNKNERVLDVVALNEDARKIVGTMDFKNSDLTVTINALVGSMLRNGYLSDVANSVLITVDGNDHTKNEEIQKKITDEINAIFKAGNLEGAILSQENAVNDTIKQLAEKHGISESKAQLVNELAKELTNHTADELADMTINELNILAEKTENVNSSGTASKKAYIGEEKALEAALTKANVKLTDAGIVEIELDSDDGLMIYEIEFISKSYEYDIEVNAVDGSIVKYQKDALDDDDDKIDTKAENNDTASKEVTSTANYISRDKAKAAALSYAQVNENEISKYVCKLDTDDNDACYDIKFETSVYEYDIEVNAVSGNVVDFDRKLIENKDHANDEASAQKPQQTVPSNSNSKNYIGTDKAKTIALNHAGVTSADIRDYSCELDEDDGVYKYEIEFKNDNHEYSYEINAVTGKIIDSEKDIDD